MAADQLVFNLPILSPRLGGASLEDGLCINIQASRPRLIPVIYHGLAPGTRPPSGITDLLHIFRVRVYRWLITAVSRDGSHDKD